MPDKLNDIQVRIAQLQEKGWTLASIADEIDLTVNAVEKWKAGDRNPSNSKVTIAFLDKLLERKRVPKKRRYTKGNRKATDMKKVEFNAPLNKQDTEFQTYGCRHTAPEICKKNGLVNVCAFVREDGICKSPSKSWARQYQYLKMGNSEGRVR